MKLFQNINFLRFVFLLFFAVMFLIKIKMLYVYTAAFYFSFEFLNANSRYQAMKFRNYYNAFIVSFVAYILLVRSEILPVSEAVVFHLNTLEHIAFSIIICLHISIYLQVFNVGISNDWMRLLFIIVIFNGIGLINEYFQNAFNDASIFQLTENSIKDLMANVLGTLLYASSTLVGKNSKHLFIAKE